MGSTITEKILGRASGKRRISSGDIIEANVDVAFTHESLGPMVFSEFRKLKVDVWDRDRIIIIVDHQVPPSTPRVANAIFDTRLFVRDYKIEHFYYGEGICHQLMPEKGRALPGEVIVGTDSHTVTSGAFGAFATGIGSSEMAWVFALGSLWFRVPESIKFNLVGEPPNMTMAKDIILHIIGQIGVNGATYKAMEFAGPTVKSMSVDARMTICNMTIEAGAKNGVIAPDEKTIAYVRSRTTRAFKPVSSDINAEYLEVFNIDVSKVEPLIANPYSPGNVKSVMDIEGTKIDQAFIGTCTGGRIEDLRMAARIIEGKRVYPDTRLIVIPASREVYINALKEGLVEVFLRAGAWFCNPNCGPCAGGGVMGRLAKDETCISTQNRNFLGRMGDPRSKVYLASPATVAASAIKGEITDPRRVWKE